MARCALTVDDRAAILAETPGRLAALTEGLTEVTRDSPVLAG